MININDYINESLFDDDIQMNKLDDLADVIKWVDLFKNPKKYPKVIKDFMSQIKKEGSERVLSHKIDKNAYYVFASCGHRFHMWGGGDGTEHYIGFLRQDSGIRDKDILRINCWRMNSKEYPNKVSFFKHSEYHSGISGQDKYIYAYKLPKKYDILVKKLIECTGQQYINESLFDIDDNIDNVDESIKDQIKQFIEDNYNKCDFFISKDINEYGKYDVSCAGSVDVKNKKITSLTNGMFDWLFVDSTFDCNDCELLKSLDGAPKSVNGGFYCSNCKSLKTLKGAPKEVGGKFDCRWCNSLKSLEGAPEKVGGGFCCYNCDSLTSLKGAPKKIGGGFYCSNCESLTSLEGAPKEVGGDFSCRGCDSLTSLEGAPKKVVGNFSCRNCRVEFTKDDVEKVSNVKGMIKV